MNTVVLRLCMGRIDNLVYRDVKTVNTCRQTEP